MFNKGDIAIITGGSYHSFFRGDKVTVLDPDECTGENQQKVIDIEGTIQYVDDNNLDMYKQFKR